MSAADMKKRKALTADQKREAGLFYLIITPFLLMFLFIKLVPMVNGVYLSMTNYAGYNYNRLKFVGLRNYLRVFTDNDAVFTLLQTFKIGLITVPISMIVGLLTALLLNNARKGVYVFRTIAFLPSIIPGVATGLMWKIMFNKDAGLINHLLNMLGVSSVAWLEYDYVMYALIIMMTWGSTGSLLINLAALKDIPEQMYEAAALDGANAWQKFWKITIPMISPVLFFNLIMNIISNLQLYSQPVLLAQGVNGVLNMPLRPVMTYMVHAYQQILGYLRYGYGLAMVWVLVIIINLLTVLVFKTQKYWVFYADGGDK